MCVHGHVKRHACCPRYFLMMSHEGWKMYTAKIISIKLINCVVLNVLFECYWRGVIYGIGTDDDDDDYSVQDGETINGHSSLVRSVLSNHKYCFCEALLSQSNCSLHEVLNTCFHKIVLHISLRSNLCYMVEAINVRKNLKQKHTEVICKWLPHKYWVSKKSLRIFYKYSVRYSAAGRNSDYTTQVIQAIQCFMYGSFPLEAQCSTLTAMVHRDFSLTLYFDEWIL